MDIKLFYRKSIKNCTSRGRKNERKDDMDLEMNDNEHKELKAHWYFENLQKKKQASNCSLKRRRNYFS
jgi:ribosome-associated toxin RatA of RatAB toxin-antitoxin module